MENIETLLAAVAQTQGFDDDEPVVPTPPPPPPSRLVNFDSSPEIPGDVGDSQLVEAPVEVSRDLLRSTANRPPETAVPATDRVIGADDKKKRGRPPRGQLAVKPPPQKRAKQEDEDEDVCFICFDGGSLVLCDRRGCPKAYHPACIKRDEAFFKSKAKWNCGWHICSVCRKASHYVCYTCTYSLCKGCTKDADYVCVRGNKGFCSTCMKTITLMENQGPVNSDSGVQVDFDDVTSWEYLFKMYWVPLKEKLSLTMSDLTKARNPWKGVAPVVCTPQLSNVLDGKVSIPIKSSEHLEINKLEEAQNKTLMPAVSRASNHIEIPNSNSGENETIFSKDTKILNANETSIGGNCGKDTFNPVIKNEEDNLSIVKDRGEPRDGNPDNSAGFVDSVASGMEVDVDNSLMQIKSKKEEMFGESEERKPQNKSRDYAAIDVHNINLIYLRRNMMENLVEDKENFHDKVLGSIVRIRISSDDQKPDVYRLVKIVGTRKVAEPYKIGDRTANIMLEVLNLDMQEVISVDAISNQDFTKDECRQLHQGIKCGLMEQFTVDEIKKKAMALQPVRVKYWLEAEILQLNHLQDQASKKGLITLREHVRKIQLLNSPEEYQRRIVQVPEIHVDPDVISPDAELEDAKSCDNSRKDEHVMSRYSESSQVNGKEDGEKIDACVSDNSEKLIDQVNVTNSTIGGRNESNDQRSEMETSSATVSVRNFLPVNIIETEKLWHHRDHNGKIQGPFSMMHLRDSSKIGLFPHNMRIWTNHEQYDSLLLTDALSGRFHGASEWRHDRNDGDSKQKETASCNNATVLPDNNSGSVRANESPSWPQCWDLLKDDEVSNGPQNTEKNPNVPNQIETTSGGNKSLQEKENPRPLPIDLSLNDIDIDSGCVSAPVSTNFPLQNSGILELLSPKEDHKASEKPPPGLPNFPVPNAGPSWIPEVANEWCGYASTPAKPCAADTWDSDLASAPSQRPHEVTNWLAMMNEPIEFDALGEESVSDLLAEVDAMESQGVFPSPTSAMKFAKEMLDCRDDCFSSIEEFSSTNDVCKPVIASSSVIEGLDSFNNSSSVGSAVENNNSSSVYTGGTGSDFHQETADPGWGAVQGNINLVTVQGNVNLVLGGPSAQGMANMGWANPYQTAGWGNPNLNQSPVNGNLPWEGPRKYGGERFPSPREWGGCYQGGGEPGFGRGRLPWGRPPFSGGGGGGYSRPPPKGQRICKFYESGRCKKGAFCDYLHPS
ncbi:hypothetical protein ABFX02_12G003200 [Erythranthe guttata]